MKGNPVEKEGWILTFQDESDRPLLNDLFWFPAYRTGRGDFEIDCIRVYREK